MAAREAVYRIEANGKVRRKPPPEVLIPFSLLRASLIITKVHQNSLMTCAFLCILITVKWSQVSFMFSPKIMFVGLVVQEYFSSADSSRFLRASSSLDQMLTVCNDSMFLWASPLIPNNLQGFRVLDSPLAEGEGCDLSSHMVPQACWMIYASMGGRNCCFWKSARNWCDRKKQEQTGSFS